MNLRASIEGTAAAAILVLSLPAGCSSPAPIPGDAAFPVASSALTAAMASAGTAEERVSLSTARIRLAAGEIGAFAEGDRALLEASARALALVIDRGLIPSLRELPPQDELPPGFMETTGTRLEDAARALEEASSRRGAPELRLLAGKIRDAAGIAAAGREG